MGQGKFKSSIGGESKLKTQWQRLIELGSFDNESKKQVSSTSITTEPAKPSMIKGERASSIQLESYATKETNVSPAIKKTSFVLEPINEAEKLSVFVYTTTVFSYCLLFLFGYFRDLYGKIFKPEEYKCYSHSDGYAPLVEGFERSFHRYVYTRIRDVFARTITGVPGRTVKILERTTNDYNLTFEYTGNSIEVMNLASYNYLGFSEKEGYCTDKVIESITQLGVTSNSTPCEVGYSEKLVMAEQLVARFVGTEDAVIISQGFSTNASVIPTIVDKGCLILSDELNHASLIYGSRISGAVIRPFKHNNIKQLEKLLRESIASGQPRTHKPWKKILLVIEGLYSMEGTIPKLNEILELKKKYKFYIYLDEAHSIGALGSRGRGVCDLLGVDPRSIDIMMGTFTKSFGASGGYIAGTKALIQRLRVTNHNSLYGETMSVPVLQQTISSMQEIMGESDSMYPHEGKKRLDQLAFNSHYFFTKLKSMGFTLIGSCGSPVIPMMIYHSSKIAAFSRECLAAGIAVVVVGYPATPVMRDRVRFCLSAAHTKQDLDASLAIINIIGERLQIKNLN